MAILLMAKICMMCGESDGKAMVKVAKGEYAHVTEANLVLEAGF